MSSPAGTRQQSWRAGQPRGGPSGTTGSVRKRQLVTTFWLIVLLLAAGSLVTYLVTRHDQHTHVGLLLSASPTQTSEPEQPYTWLPLRFASESLAPLLAEKTSLFHAQPLTPNFDNSDNLLRALSEQLSQLEHNDAFVLWVRAKGATFAGEPYLVGGNYRLPETGADLTNPAGAVSFKSLVSTVSRWTGPVLILLDWGNQVCDPRSGMWDNPFLTLVLEEMQAAPSQVFCLVSHQAGEISLDALNSRQTLFGRACAEAIVGPRRQPAEPPLKVESSDALLIGDVAEYVVRRVWADSAGRQRPWLIQGTSGWLSPAAPNWQNRTRVSIARRGDNQRLWGWSQPVAAEATAEGTTNTAATSSTAEPSASTASATLAESAWPTSPLWQTLDQWRTPKPELAGWSLATLAPLSAKRMVTMALEFEQRWLAGQDFGGENELRLRAESLRQVMLQEAESILREARAGPLAHLLREPAPEVSAAEIAAYRQRTTALLAFRQLALVFNDCAGLADNLARLEDAPSVLSRVVEVGQPPVSIFLQQLVVPGTAIGSVAGESLERLRPSDAVRLTKELNDLNQQLENGIAALLARVITSPLQQRHLADMLARYGWLSHAQRNQLLLSMLTAEPKDAALGWPSQDWSLFNVAAPHANASTLPPQRVQLVEAVAPIRVLDSLRPHLTPAETITAIRKTAANAANGLLYELDVLLVDGRDLCQQEGSWSPNLQFPPFPDPPQPAASWHVAWEKPSGGQLVTPELMQLSSSSQPARIDFVMTRIGDAQDVEALEIRLTGLEARLAGDGGAFQSGSLKLDRDNLLQVVDLQADAHRVPVEFRSTSHEENSPRSIQIQIAAGMHAPPASRLACRLPLSTPVELIVQQWMSRHGVADWENCPRNGNLVTLQPFPGRKSNFRCLVANQDGQPREVTVELYKLPARSSTHAKGRISETSEIPAELADQSLKSFTLLAKSTPLALAPNARNVEVNFSSPTAAASQPSGGGAATPPTTPGGSSGANDVTWGLMAVVSVSSEPDRTWRHWLQLHPVDPADYLTTSSTYGEDARTITFTVALKDANQDQLPDWVPADFSDEQPIVLDCQIGGGIDLSQATFPAPRGVLSKDKPQQLFTVTAQRSIDAEVELQISVDGSARGLFEFVGVRGRAARRVPPNRLKLLSIGTKDGLTYFSDFQTNLGEQQRYLDNFGAMFKRPVADPLNIVLAIDTASRGRIGAVAEPVEIVLAGPGWRQPVGEFFGDRNLTATLASSSGATLTIECQLSDWTLAFDPSSLGDVSAQLMGTLGQSSEQTLGRIVLDGSGPTAATPPPATTTAGRNMSFAVPIQDLSPLSEGTLTLEEAGKPNTASPLGDKLTRADFSLANNRWEMRARTLAVSDLKPGRYSLRLQLTDILGNESNLGPWPLEIQSPTNAGGGGGNQPVRGDVNGRLFFGQPNRKSPNPVTVKVKDLPAKTASSNDGKFRIADLDPGEYTLQATTEWQGKSYQGEASLKLEKQVDYQQLVDIILAPAEK